MTLDNLKTGDRVKVEFEGVVEYSDAFSVSITVEGGGNLDFYPQQLEDTSTLWITCMSPEEPQALGSVVLVRKPDASESRYVKHSLGWMCVTQVIHADWRDLLHMGEVTVEYNAVS